jgi:hypothetical protein
LKLGLSLAKDNNKELVVMLNVKNKQEDAEENKESVGKDIIGIETHEDIQQVEIFFCFLNFELTLNIILSIPNQVNLFY